MKWPFSRRRVREPIPDAPVPFGYKMTWWSIRSADSNDVADAVRMHNAQPSDWKSGIQIAYSNGHFISPAVNNWVFICGSDLLPNSEDAAEQVGPRLVELSRRFGECQVFATHRIVDYHVWARARDGTITRGFGHLGESGVTFWDDGFDSEEDSLGFNFANFDDSDSEDELDPAEFPAESNVMDVARVWSVCPVELGDHWPVGLGLVGDAVFLRNP